MAATQPSRLFPAPTLSAQSVTIGDATAGAVIYYTTDGTTPATSSSVFSSPIRVSSNETLKAIAVANSYADQRRGDSGL